MPNPRDYQLRFNTAPVNNSGLFSSHWLDHRLPDTPEWSDSVNRGLATSVLEQLAKLWETVKPQAEYFATEDEVEDAWIRPALDLLGWSYIPQRRLRNRKPDYALFLDTETRSQAQRLANDNPDFWNLPGLLADAKAWGLPLDQKMQIRSQRELPHEQIEWYLDRSRLPYAILTNGRDWRLIPRELRSDQKRLQTFYGFDLPEILDRWNTTTRRDKTELVDDFLRFYLFFSPIGFQDTARGPLVQRAVDGSSVYRLGVSEGLKARVFDALRLCIEGFINHKPNGLADDEASLLVVREQSFTLLYRLLFIFYAEDRGLLPVATNQTYRNNRSLRRHRDEVASHLERLFVTDYGNDTTLYDDLYDLFDLIDRGHRTYGVPAYNGGLFDPERHPFLIDNKLPDRYMAQVIDGLSRAKHDENPEAGLVFVDYRDLAIQHLGTIYEGLLELRPRLATEPMVVVRSTRGKRTEKTVPANNLPEHTEPTGETYAEGQVYLETDKGERRASGSYYTPDHIVNHIVEHTLGPLCESISDELDQDIAQAEDELKGTRGKNRTDCQSTLDQLRGAFDDRVLQLRVLDPAMGSGHFLLAACSDLALRIATHPHTADPDADHLHDDEPLITYWKRRVVERCLYGVDLNAMAVELAKLALWLETVSADQPLTFLDHHLRHGNALVGAWVEDLDALPDAQPLQRVSYQNQFTHRLAALLNPLRDIRNLSSDTTDRVKQKERLYRDAFGRVAAPFRAIADLWTASFFADDPDNELAELYPTALQTLGQTAKAWKAFNEESALSRFSSAATSADVTAFHWELAFPEVFFDETGRLDSAGFDAVIGNPPYDVLSSKELGRDISDLKAFIEHEAAYEPSRVGKNNLYKLFICQAIRLLADDGRFGFIVPMALLGDLSASGIRSLMLERGAFTGIEAFPQKDNAERRVFREAKLSTTLFHYRKAGPTEAPFIARNHPGRTIETDSPSLSLTNATIPLYDPENRTIVSCDQDDWNLATRIMASGRMRRLGEVAEFFQGEVNETVQRKKGNLLASSEGGRLVTRGASVCLYTTRKASQGDDLHVDVQRFLDGASPGSKAFHHRDSRVIWQESSPQNNFRRIIAARLGENEFCNHTINYGRMSDHGISLLLLTAILNSNLAEWYFRLGSTNAHVNQYQIEMLPLPVLDENPRTSDDTIKQKAVSYQQQGDFDAIFEILSPHLFEPPFPKVVADVIEGLVERIEAIERGRGRIARAARSRLAEEAQPYQDLIDRLFYAMAGLTDAEAAALETRLDSML